MVEPSTLVATDYLPSLNGKVWETDEDDAGSFTADQRRILNTRVNKPHSASRSKLPSRAKPTADLEDDAFRRYDAGKDRFLGGSLSRLLKWSRQGLRRVSKGGRRSRPLTGTIVFASVSSSFGPMTTCSGSTQGREYVRRPVFQKPYPTPATCSRREASDN